MRIAPKFFENILLAISVGYFFALKRLKFVFESGTGPLALET